MVRRQGRTRVTPLGLYLHIPFCQAICTYCNFNRGLLDVGLKARYVQALEAEIRRSAYGGQAADTVFFGGGTPSLLEPDEVGRLLGACRASFTLAADAEITLETNPETATEARLQAFRAAGVTRLSFGVQSFDDGELRKLGRVHSASTAADAVRAASTVGFASVSFDLMLWLPGQSRASWRRTMAEALALTPDHLSLYLLELYPNAPLKEDMARAAWSQVPDDDAADMYLEALESCEAAGLAQYEISNVARPGHRSRHNLKYWQAGRWVGFGCGAHSTVDGRRWRNVAGTDAYVEALDGHASVEVSVESLGAQARFEEALFTGLRLTDGVDESEVEARFGVAPWARYGQALEPFVETGRMWRKNGRFGLTRQGMLVANSILESFV